MSRLILASASPRRRELLAAAGYEIELRPAGVDETPLPGESAAALVVRLARAKARAAARPGDELPVLGADTEVELAGVALGQPADAAAAAAMLRRLSGGEHRVLTGLALRLGERERVSTTITRVWMRPIAEAEIAAYVAGGEPFGKAGGYAIQGQAAAFIERVEGSWSNVVGLPLETLAEMLQDTPAQ